MSEASPAFQPRRVIFLEGPVGAGKTTLGRALALRIGGGFIDGDAHADPTQPWYGSILSTSRAIVAEGMAMLAQRPPEGSAVVIAYPLTCIEWIYFRRRFGDAGIRTLFVSLSASLEAIVQPGRNRVFSAAEQARIRTMIAEGYGARRFSDLVVDTQGDFAATLAELEQQVCECSMLTGGPGSQGRRL